MSTTDTRAAFEAWAKDEGLIQESHGIMSINSMCDVARKAFDAGIAHAEAAKATGTAGEQAQVAYESTDTARLDWLDETNSRFKMGWRVGQAPAGNVSIQSVLFAGVKPVSIREAIDAIRCKDWKDVEKAEAARHDKDGNYADDLRAWLDEARDEIEVQGAAFHAISLKLKAAEAELAARQPAPVVIDYSVLLAYADEKRIPYNELCATVHAATNRSQPCEKS